MGKNILGKLIIVCAKYALRKRRVNEAIAYANIYSLVLTSSNLVLKVGMKYLF